MSAIALQPLLDARTLWQAGRQARAPVEVEPTGHAALDALLPALHADPEARKLRWSLDVDPAELY